MDRRGSMKQIVIGLTGPIAGGKGAVAEILKNLGAVCFSLSDRVREVATEKRHSHERKNLQDVGDDLRKTLGGGVLAKLTAAKAFVIAPNAPLIVIDSIRNPGEIEFLRQHKGFILVAVTASQDIRFERLRKRNRPSDPKEKESFLVADNRDLGIGQESLGQQVGACIEMADLVFENNGDATNIKTFVSGRVLPEIEKRRSRL